MKSFISILVEEFEHEKRHRIAQQNAALPVEQGGLGLSKDNTSMDRAKAMGYTTKAYHGTSHDFTKFSKKHIGKHFGDEAGFFFTPSTSHADKYDNKTGKVIGTWTDSGTAGSYADHSSDHSGNPQHIIPVLLKMNNPKVIEGDTDGEGAFSLVERRNYTAGEYFNDHVLPHGHDGMVVRDIGSNISKNGRYGDVTVNNAAGKDEFYAVKNPHQIRSIHAAFDPKHKNSRDILA